MLVTGSAPFPFITKDGSLSSFQTITQEEFNQDFNYGDVITGSYPQTSQVSSDFFLELPYVDENGTKKRNLLALKNTLNYYSYLSPHYSFSSSYGNKEEQLLRLISIPSIFYGQNLKKGSVVCKWYYSGSLIAELQDVNKDGELIQVGPEGTNGNGSVAGVVLYNEGFLILTGSWSLHPTYQDKFNVYDNTSDYSPAWHYFMTTGSEGSNIAISSSFLLDFEGTEKIPVVTMLAKAEKGEFNHSNNPSYVEYGQDLSFISSSQQVKEAENIKIKNIVDTIYDDEDPPFEKITYISKVAIYDEEKNLIGVAKLAKPVRKRQNDNITFKLKLDL